MFNIFIAVIFRYSNSIVTYLMMITYLMIFWDGNTTVIFISTAQVLQSTATARQSTATIVIAATSTAAETASPSPRARCRSISTSLSVRPLRMVICFYAVFAST